MPVRSAMIIDDDTDLSQVLSVILQTRKIHVLTAQSLGEAEQYLTYLKPTIIFLDNSFPDGLGINFIRNIRDTDEEIKIIMMTADTASWIKEKAWEEGVNYFMEKPLDIHKIDLVLDDLRMRNKA